MIYSSGKITPIVRSVYSVSFQCLLARTKKPRRANSVLTRGSCNCPLSVARVLRTDLSERRTSLLRKSSDALSEVSSWSTRARSLTRTISPTHSQPSSLSTGVTCSRRLSPDTIRALKLTTFCNALLLRYAAASPHTDAVPYVREYQGFY